MCKYKFQSLFFFVYLISIFSTLECSGQNKDKKKKYVYQLAVAAIFRDEAPYLEEWIEYHKLIGCDHFYLYNNLSSDDCQKVLLPYIKKGEVELIEWPYDPETWSEWDIIQGNAYGDALKRAKKKAKWLAIIDLDEFLVSSKYNNFVDLLKKCNPSRVGGICLMWSFFGTSFVDKIADDKLMIEELIYHSGPAAGGDESQVWNQGSYKSIVRPDYVNAVISPHYCSYVEGKDHGMYPYNIAHINHYWARDEYYLNNYKIPRREFWGFSPETTKGWAAGMNVMTDNNPILRFVPKLKKKMHLLSQP